MKKEILKNLEMIQQKDKEWGKKIHTCLKELEKKGWGNRKFRILYGHFITKPMTVYEYIDACISNPPKQLFFAVQNIYNKFKNPKITLLSVRDIFEGHQNELMIENKSCLGKKGLIETKVALMPGKIKVPEIEYKGVLPESLSKEELYSLFERMAEIKKSAKMLVEAEATTSLTHIVISSFYKCKDRNFMIITATNTSKDKISMFSETPIVTKDKKYYYYGDYLIKPSAESAPHWVIHSTLHKDKNPLCWSIIHIHNDRMTKISEHSNIKLKSVYIPVITKFSYSTEEIGKEIAGMLKEHKTFGVSVKAHGQWFVGKNLIELAEQIGGILKEVKGPR
ncbi:MAG: class II aldolase/adducin family protein [bacterium]